ncbi:hypothetical protein TNCT_733781 [Trichonephila clavata]|uniref:Uncharacterized protein n=1 Tax=Trichonephila clavata TaxID=2740835 RepID=A0A8X6KPS5_TRICU|nr:hypothetical protein TNCT_733781 [Trichonephila clavata]
MLIDLSDISDLHYQELRKFQNDASIKTLFNIKGVMCRGFCEGTEIKYLNVTNCARELLLPFPSSSFTKCGYSPRPASKKKKRTGYRKNRDLSLKLNTLEPGIKSLCNNQ